MIRMDLNCDMGELPEAIKNGTQSRIMRWLTSANIACGGHAGDAQTMEATIRQAQACRVAIGAHPGYPDRENFGRLELDLSPQQISDTVFEQVSVLDEIAQKVGAKIVHVKPHGALYNQAAKSREIASAIATGVARWNRNVILVGLAGSSMLEEFRDAGFLAAAEAFADRRYEPDGTLRSRRFPDALIDDSLAASVQATRIATQRKVISVDGSEVTVVAQTICIHGDGPHAAEFAEKIWQGFRVTGVERLSLARIMAQASGA